MTDRPEDRTAKGKRRTLIAMGCAFAVMVGLVIYSPTLYRMFCAVTGVGGAVRQISVPNKTADGGAAPEGQSGSTTDAVADASDMVEVYFDANVAKGLPWEFYPEERKVTAKLGEPVKTYYYAKNNSDETIVARAVFNVTPYKSAQYFFKIECFCFTNEKLAPGESARMPLVLYIDDQIHKDPNTAEVKDITLSYTFYRQSDLTDQEIADARELKAGSDQKEDELSKSENIDLENDVRRH
ncbi:cytochrome c oxidase assembly protein [Thalassospira marina]|uniref:Cytochrome c oxidase assembly protein CtaG n=2 Tax=Thalassospira marina TaxID=2048283 RepID=A0A2N3KSG7_9PROT|nr:cytochrome c oxidase assembly protein [Thalassospira marina]